MATKNNRDETSIAFLKPNALALEGDSDDLLANYSEEKNKAIEQAVTSGENTILLPLGQNNADVLFELWVIPHHEIQERTIPHRENTRQVKFISALDRRVCRDMIAEEGSNLYPAIGCLNERTGKIEIIDGLRRSIGCTEAQCDYRIYVTRQPIIPHRAHKISTNSNKHVSNGLLDMRVAYKRDTAALQSKCQLEGLEPLSQNQLIKELGVPRSTYITAMQSFDVPEELFIAFPSPSTLGRPALREIHKYATRSGVSKDDVKKMAAKLAEHVASQDYDSDVGNANRGALAYFKKHFAPSNPIEKDKQHEPYVLPNDVGQVTLAKDGSVKMNLKSLTEASIDSLMTQLKAMLEDAR